ncbi:hypothetical protein ACOJVU_11880 [Mycobacterium sp. THU-M104]|uniref:hypothetical protein n=1 Tax=unclassified Mycobacterium TaxID=2642494 RepID=UPI00389AB8A7
MTAQAFVDESGRGARYYVCVAVVADGDVDSLRRLARSLCLPGQRRWHFVHERVSRRRQIVDALVSNASTTALVFHGKGDETTVRAESFRRMVRLLLDRNVTRLVIESREGRDHLDRQVLVGELREQSAGFGYDHMPAHSDPLLWVADAVAWCSSAGGVWAERIHPLVAHLERVVH